MSQCQPAQDPASDRRQQDPDFALVFNARSSRDCARDLEAVHQFHGAVMLDEKSGRDLADGGLHAFRKTLDREQQLMLLRLDLMLLRGGFTEMEETPDLPPELGEIAVLIEGKITHQIYRNTI